MKSPKQNKISPQNFLKNLKMGQKNSPRVFTKIQNLRNSPFFDDDDDDNEGLDEKEFDETKKMVRKIVTLLFKYDQTKDDKLNHKATQLDEQLKNKIDDISEEQLKRLEDFANKEREDIQLEEEQKFLEKLEQPKDYPALLDSFVDGKVKKQRKTRSKRRRSRKGKKMI
jgi:hypothetical protein